MRWTKHNKKRKEEKEKNKEKWHIWFAWYPIDIHTYSDGSKRKVLFEHIERRGKFTTQYNVFWDWEYRENFI